MDTNKDLVLLGSKTAKAGFKNEDDIVKKFNNWKNDKDAKEWLEIMGYKIDEINNVVAVKVGGGVKTDVQVQVAIFFKKIIAAENISIKLVSNPRGFNQIDKRKVQKYIDMWSLPESIATALKYFTGESSPYKNDTRDKRRMFLDELDEKIRNDILIFFTQNKILIVSDLLKGRGELSADWMLVALKFGNDVRWTLQSINHVLNLFGSGDVVITKQGNLRIGKITMQRKGGDRGRESAKMLQFKINPVELFSRRDNNDSISRSKIMSRIKSNNSKIESSVAKALWVKDFRYRRNVKEMVGKPDFFLKKYNTVIFIDSCFWHGCKLHLRMPSSRKDYWESKIKRNMERDKEVNEFYISHNINIIRVWEHDLNNNFELTIQKVINKLNEFNNK